MADLHGVVVDDVGEVVGWHAIALEQYFVVEVVGIDNNPTADEVRETDVAVARHFHADNVGFAGS